MKVTKVLAAYHVCDIIVMAALFISCAVSIAQPVPSPALSKVTVDSDGTVHLPAFAVPLSSYMSAEAKKRFIKEALSRPVADSAGHQTIAETREQVNKWYRTRVERAKSLYPVTIVEQKIAGVSTDVVTPLDGVTSHHRDRVLINLHGGGFSVGAGWGGLAESIPIAGTGRFEVITVDYRMAPEYKFPAASEDVAVVYRELLKRYKPENIGFLDRDS